MAPAPPTTSTRSCSDEVLAARQRIDAFEDDGPGLNALVSEPSEVLGSDEAATAPRGSPLACVPVAIKDNVAVRGVATTAGSHLLEDAVAEEDATLVQRLRDAGALVVATTNMDDFAHGGAGGRSSVAGQTRNPHDLDQPPGSSSAGSAVAVAAGYATAAIGTDTGGSVRLPAAANRLVGVKPTLDRVPLDGVVPFAASFDVAGPLTRTVWDAAVVLDVIADTGRTHRDAVRSGELSGVRIGVPAGSLDTDPGRRMVADLDAAGARIVDLPAFDPGLLATLQDAYRLITGTEFADGLADHLASLPEGAATRSFDAVVQDAQRPNGPVASVVASRFASAAARPGPDAPAYQEAEREAPAAARAAIDELLEAHDVAAIAHDGEPLLASVSGYPEVVVPAGGTGTDGAALHLLGTSGADAPLLGYAAAYERVRADVIPPTLTPFDGTGPEGIREPGTTATR
ncbi:MAG: amidase [Nitriliruptoraceae bacterium]